MTQPLFTDDELLAWLDELLPVARMAEIEKAMRTSDPLRYRAAGLARRRDQGGHSIGEIWRRLRLSCPTRSELGSFLLQTLDDAEASYIDFHVKTVGCRYCLAVLDDMQQNAQPGPEHETRRRRFFESSAGLLRRDDDGS